MINQSIFKSYDVRGIYPSELDEKAGFAVGKAFIKLTGAKKVVVGFDARLSSLALFKALVAGLVKAGADVTTIGQVPTECLYFATASYDFDSGIMITASHNPKDYNGFKMLIREGKNINIVRGKDLLSLIEEAEAEETGTDVKNLDIGKDFQDFILQFSGEVKPFKIAIDASNGVIGSVISRLKEKLSVEILDLNFEPDGNFPNHSPNPLEEGAVNQIAEKIKTTGADFGFMFDGDADRIFLVDEKGQQVSADIVLLLLAKHFLAKYPGRGIAYNLICSRSVPEFVKKWGGVPIRTQVGFVNVRQGLLDNDGVVGGELSAHYCFADYFYMDSGMIAFLTMLQIISKEGKPVSEIVKELTVYAKPLQSTFKITDSAPVLEKIKQKYADGKQDFLDGVTVEYDNWWFNARPSNTEPLLKLTIEAETEEMLQLRSKELSEFIGNS
ncbi:phosphomannomutase/phosphoglucomutase [Candidatus Parcubacteria bacterium]|nr:phosphomannomutase/phosphoglucomutase [Candidatus Parcubacteria bacterium]